MEIRLAVGQTGGTHIRIPSERRRFLPIFMNEDGRVFLPTARHIWDQLLANEVQVSGMAGNEETVCAHDRLQVAAEEAGAESFESLRQAHGAALDHEEQRGETAFAARRRAIERIGLPEVRRYRLARCQADEAEWRSELESARQIVPEIRSLLMLRIVKGGSE